MKKANFKRLRVYPFWFLIWILVILEFYLLVKPHMLLILQALVIIFLIKDIVIDIGMKKGHWPQRFEHFPFSFLALLIGIFYIFNPFLIIIAAADSVIDFLEDIKILVK